MKRVTLVARPATGGIRAHVVELISRLPRDHWSVALAAPSDLLANLPKSLPELEAIPCPVTAKPSLADFTAARILRATVTRPDDAPPGMVHAHGIRAGFVAALANHGRIFSLIVTYHNIPPDSALGHAVLRFIASRSRALIVVSGAIKSRVSPQALVIPNGIDLAAYTGHDRKAARAQFGVGEEQLVAVCASRSKP